MTPASGINIPDPETILRGYVRTVCPRFDCREVPRDNELRADEIRLSRKIGSRLYEREVDAILAVGNRISEELENIAPDVDLMTIPEGGEIPGERALSRLITFMCDLPGIKLPKTAKILHKKRPSVLPVLDTVVQYNYWPTWVPSVRGRSNGDYAIALIRAFHRDMHSVAEELLAVRDVAVDMGVLLTPCRTLDLLIWVVRTNNIKWFSQRA
jgi:hypothetical protein